MTSEESTISMAECGACRTVIPVDSTSCPKCGISFQGVSDEALGACGACDGLAPLDSPSCPHCGVSFIADNVVEVLSNWLSATGLSVSSLFSRFDVNDDGEISSEELRDGLLALNLADLPPSQIEKLISILDEDGNGTIDLGELEGIIAGESSAKKDSSVQEGTADDSGDNDSEEDSKEKDSEEEESEDSDDDSDEEESEDSDDDSDEEESEDSDDDSDEEESEDSDDDSDEEESEDSDDDSDEEESEDSDDDSDEEESEDSDDDSDEEESEDSDDDADEEEELSNLQVLGIAIAKSDMSIKEVFEAMDTNNDGRINGPELQKGIVEICGERLSPDEVYEMLKQFDEDDDGSLDPMELIEAIESLDMDIVSDKKATKKKVKPKKPFPTDLQKAMMGKKWNDIYWPLIHFALFAMAAIWIANGLIGFVDGTGGNIAYDGEGAFSEGGEWLEKGDVYACESDVQNSECKNSLTPLAGDGSSSMPVGFYWDGILIILLFFAGMGGSIYAHLVLMKNWRNEAKKLKDESGDSDDGDEGGDIDSDDDEDGDSDDDGDGDSDDDEDDSDDDEDGDSDDDDDDSDDDEDDSDDDEDDDSEGEDEIDIGSRIGVEVDGKEYFGEIIEFNDEEETVVIEDEDSGDEITAMQDDMFVE
jgi:Ca2+-binding EF-hand superfamily protein/RNA polymerase subunit RPABC4/transcription elongation factor Spt4